MTGASCPRPSVVRDALEATAAVLATEASGRAAAGAVLTPVATAPNDSAPATAAIERSRRVVCMVVAPSSVTGPTFAVGAEAGRRRG